MRSDLVSRLYRAARELPTQDFQEAAIELVKPVLRFESSFWGIGIVKAPGLDVLSVHEHESDPEFLQTWNQINAQDPVVPICFANPGTTIQFHAATLFTSPTDAAMRDLTRRFGRESALITQVPHEDSGTSQYLSFFRPDRRALYSESERLACQTLIPHLAEALRISRALNATSQVFDALENGKRALLLADFSGRIRFAQQRFLQLVALEWPQFDGMRLPTPLWLAPGQPGRTVYVGGAVHFKVQPCGDMLLVEARLKTAFDRLPTQRGRIASLYACGHSAKAIARRLGLAPSTVRNQIRAAYEALGITSKAQLIAAAQPLVRDDEVDGGTERLPFGQS